MPLDYESAVDNIQRELRKSDKSLWACARFAARAGVGEWEDDVTNNLAAHVGKSPVTVRLWVRARELFRELYTVKRYMTIVWRRELSLSHFARMRTLQARYGLTVDEMTAHFESMIKHKRDCLPYAVATLEAEVVNSKKPVQYQEYYTPDVEKRIINSVIRWRSLAGLPEDFPRHALNTLMEWVESRMK